MKNTLLILIHGLFIFLVGCQKQHAEKVIARVGDVELTLKDAKAHIDTSQAPLNKQLRKFVMHWVNEEIIHQEARKKGIENTDRFQRQIEDVKRQLANQFFIEQQVYNDKAKIEEQTSENYFENHKTEFSVQENVMKVNLITFNNREHASEFASQVSTGKTWSDVVDNILQDSSALTGLVSHIEERYFTQYTLFPGELWKVALTLNINEISFPVKSSIGYSIIQIASKWQRGEPATYDLVRDEVRQRVIIEQRRTRYNEILENLRKQYKVEILLSPSSLTDSNSFRRHE